MKARIWRDFLAAVWAAPRRRTPAQDEALRAERARGVDRLGEHVVLRDAPKPTKRPDDRTV